MNKKLVLIVVAVLVLVGGGVGLFAMRGNSSEPSASPTPRPRLSLPENVIPVSERPFVSLQPTTGREVIIEIGELKKPAESVDFELEYSSGTREEAAIGALTFTGTPPYKKTILLGSQSGGGKISYHEEVTGGVLALTFYDENYKLTNEWSYIDNRKPATAFSSRDAKFQIETAKLFNAASYVVVYNNPGLPEEHESALLAGPYSISSTGAFPKGQASVTLRLTEEKDATIYGWTGTAWKALTTTTSGKTAEATGDLMSTYIAVEK